jgi:hypothetical protein
LGLKESHVVVLESIVINGVGKVKVGSGFLGSKSNWNIQRCNKLNDVSPIIDSDALVEENELKKKLPDNQFVGDKRALHEGSLMHDLLELLQTRVMPNS